MSEPFAPLPVVDLLVLVPEWEAARMQRKCHVMMETEPPVWDRTPLEFRNFWAGVVVVARALYGPEGPGNDSRGDAEGTREEGKGDFMSEKTEVWKLPVGKVVKL